MTAKIVPKKSTVADKVPLSGDLEAGEIAVNLTDAKLYAKHTDGTIVNLSGAPELHTHQISQVDGLQSALDGKADSSHSHTASDLPNDVMYEGDNVSLLTNDSGYIIASEAPVQSVNGATGAVVLDTGDISEGTNLYYTNSRARGAIAVSGDLSYSSTTGVISFNETYSSATDLLTAVKTVDGHSSGLDADTLDGKHASAFATSTQGSLANSAVQPGDLASVATSGNYNDLTNLPSIAAVALSPTPPASASPGDFWFDISDGSFNIFYDDGESQQWVGLTGGNDVPLTIGMTIKSNSR